MILISFVFSMSSFFSVVVGISVDSTLTLSSECLKAPVHSSNKFSKVEIFAIVDK